MGNKKDRIHHHPEKNFKPLTNEQLSSLEKAFEKINKERTNLDDISQLTNQNTTQPKTNNK